MQKFTVRWLEEYEIVVEAENENEAVELVKARISSGIEGEQIDTFDFRVVEE